MPNQKFTDMKTALKVSWHEATWRKRLGWLTRPPVALAFVLSGLAGAGAVSVLTTPAPPPLPAAVQRVIRDPSVRRIEVDRQSYVIYADDPIAVRLRHRHEAEITKWRVRQ